MADRSDSIPVDEAFECGTCGERWYYTKPACPDCGSTAIDSYTLDAGVLESVTTVHATPDGVRSPNHLALARFDGVGLIAQVETNADPPTSTPAPGDRVTFAGEHTLRDGETGPRLVVDR